MRFPELPERIFGHFTWRDFKPVVLSEENYWIYLRGNMQQFGKWDGFWGTIRLWSPLLNMIKGWRVRHMSLGFISESGEELDIYQTCALKQRLSSASAPVEEPREARDAREKAKDA